MKWSHWKRLTNKNFSFASLFNYVNCTWACRCPNWPKITTPSRFATYISKKFVLCTKSHIFGFTLRYSFIISHCLGGIQAFSCNGFTGSPNIWAAPYVRLRRLGPERSVKFIMFIGASIINIISICKFNLMKLKVIFTNLISYWLNCSLDTWSTILSLPWEVATGSEKILPERSTSFFS